MDPTKAREYLRATVSWRARIVLGPNLYQDTRVINISEGGMGLLSDRASVEGSTVDVVVAIPLMEDRSRLFYAQVRGTVVFNVLSQEKFRVGVQFTQIDNPTRTIIRKWLMG